MTVYTTAARMKVSCKHSNYYSICSNHNYLLLGPTLEHDRLNDTAHKQVGIETSDRIFIKATTKLLLGSKVQSNLYSNYSNQKSPTVYLYSILLRPKKFS